MASFLPGRLREAVINAHPGPSSSVPNSTTPPPSFFSPRRIPAPLRSFSACLWLPPRCFLDGWRMQQTPWWKRRRQGSFTSQTEASIDSDLPAYKANPLPSPMHHLAAVTRLCNSHGREVQVSSTLCCSRFGAGSRTHGASSASERSQPTRRG